MSLTGNHYYSFSCKPLLQYFKFLWYTIYVVSITAEQLLYLLVPHFFFFLEYIGKLCIIVLIEEKRSHTETQTHIHIHKQTDWN